MTITSYTASMAVNALVTGLIIYKILKVFLEVKGARTLVEKTLGSTGGSTKRSNRIRHGVVCYPTDSHRVLHPTSGVGP